jgi:hypothetical protein
LEIEKFFRGNEDGERIFIEMGTTTEMRNILDVEAMSGKVRFVQSLLR